MHVAWASFTFASSSMVTTFALAAFVCFARSPDVSRTVLRRQPASRPLPAAIAYDKSNEAHHVA